MRREIFSPDVADRERAPSVVASPVTIPAPSDSGQLAPRKRPRSTPPYALRLALCVAAFIAAAILARGQQNATIVGTITDTSGSLVPGVAVSVNNVNTGVTLTAVTNSAGYYRVENLIP